MGEVRIKSGNLALWDKQWLVSVSGVVEYDKNVWASIIDVRDINTIYLSGDVTKLNNSIYRIGRFTEYPELGVVGIRSTSPGGVLDVTNYNFCLVSCSLYSMPTTRQDLVDEFMITLGSTPPTEFQPYFLNRPAHQFTNGQFVDIPTHHFTNGRWQGELTSQSPLKFRADGEMLDWRIEGASGGVGDWDETEQKYKIPVTVNGVTTNLYTTAQLMGGDSLDFATDQTSIPITQGDNTLTVGTAVQPSKVFVKFEG